MAINISAPIKRTGAYPVDETLLLTKAEMKVINDNVMPDVYFALCSEDGKLYIYNKSNTVDDDTGKFRVMEGGGGSEDYEQLINQPQINNITLLGNKTSEDLGLQAEIEDITNQDIDKIIYGG